MTMKREAVISNCGLYRYSLTRRWNRGPIMLFVMLNPSTADADVDDPTIRRCIGFARREGMAELRVVNLWPFRSPNTAALHEWINGGKLRGAMVVNGRHIEDELGACDQVVVAWGADKSSWPNSYSFERVCDRLGLMDDPRRVRCLGTTKRGQPRHPLYVKADTTLQNWIGALRP